MKLIHASALTALTAIALETHAFALGVGDAAPELKVSKWVKGAPVPSLQSNGTYVVEFWATWCGPCRATIPHLTEMARQFTNVTFIGVDVWERGADKEAIVNKFIKQMGDQMDYHVAMDTDAGFMADNWMKAADQNGIPAAFLVHQGMVVWIGHPMSGLESTIKEVSAGKFDLAKSKKRADAQKKLEAFYEKAMQGGNEEEIINEGRKLEALDKELGGITPGEPFNLQDILDRVKFQAAMQSYQRALFSGAPAEEIGKLEAAAKAVAPKEINFDEINKQLKAYLGQAKSAQNAANLFTKYIQAVGENGDKENAAELAKQLEALKIESPQLLNEFAWKILTDDNIKNRDLALATRLAKAGVDASEGQDPAVIDTYAKALFDSGKITEAIENQKKAVAISNADAKAELEATLKKYEAAVAKEKK